MAFWLVVAGVAIEAVCTIFLFVFDEGISTAQQSRIGALDAEVSDTRNTAKTALASAQHNVDVANDLLEENLRLRAKIADREVRPDDRALIRERLRGNQHEITVVVTGMREPQVYAASIGKALGAAGFKVIGDAWPYGIPSDTGVVFCEIQDGDQKIYDVLRLAHVATKFVGLKDRRPEFCDRPGIESPIEQLIGQWSGGLLTPEKVGRLLPRGTLAKWHGPRIYVGQKPE